MTITPGAEDNMERYFPSLSEDIRAKRELREKRMRDHKARVALMLDEIKRWHLR